MADHNGDFSDEAEWKRLLKREKMQRRRIRARIEEGRATPEEIQAITDFEAGEPWAMPETTSSRARSRAAQGEESERESAPFPWKGAAIVGGIFAAAGAGLYWLGKHFGPGAG